MSLSISFLTTIFLTGCFASFGKKCHMTSCSYNGGVKWSMPKREDDKCSEITLGGHSSYCPDKDTTELFDTPFVTSALNVPFQRSSAGKSMIPSTQICETTGETWANDNCSDRCTCYDTQWVCNSTYECSVNAACVVSNGLGQCVCKTGYTSDGENCKPFYKDCQDAYKDGHREDGVYTILPTDWPDSPFNVSCDMSTAGGWTIFQRRIDGKVNFYRNWTSYKHGFGLLYDGREFWLGNEKLFYLTNQEDYTLRVEIGTNTGGTKFAEYEMFRIGNEDSQYYLENVGTLTGNAGDGLYISNGRSFSTYDRDNDECEIFNCALEHYGAWWYTNNWCTPCHNQYEYCDDFVTNSSCHNVCARSNLNSGYREGKGNGKNMNWNYGNNCDIISSEMKIKPHL